MTDITCENVHDIKYENASLVLKQKREMLFAQYLKGDSTAFLERHTRLLDDYFFESFEKSLIGPEMAIDKNPFSIIALGGYGREEQCIHSDVDLLFLFREKVPENAVQLIKEVVYPLWDIGLDVGHATRSLKECINIAEKDYQVLTSLLDARFVCGMSLLYSDLMEQLHKKILIKRSERIINWLVESNTSRHLRFGDSAYMLEPNLKEGQGGLRDYHTMLWIARIMSDIKTPRDLEYYGYLSHDEFRNLSESLTYIWHTRNRLHYLTGRKCDQLYFDYQPKVAKAMKSSSENGHKQVETFLGELHGRMEFIKQQFMIFLYELGHDRKQTRKRKTVKNTKIEGLEITKRGSLGFASSEKLLSNPELLITIFEESANLRIPISAEGKRLIREFGYLVDDSFRSSPSVIRTFEKILVAPASSSNILDEILNTGFLERFIPEIKGIINRIQFDEYHLYPVDRHSLRTVRTVKSFGTDEDITGDWLCGNLYQELKNRKILLWAALLHDIGKGEPGGGHSKRGADIVRRILTRIGFKQEKIEAISFLTEEHLLLIKTATRRDINDEETAFFCAGKIKDIEFLKMLYLLTVADSMSTGPKAWNDWTFTLLRDFFLKILSIMEKGELASNGAVEAVENKKRKLLNAATSAKHKNDIENHIEFLPPRYLLYTTDHEIIEHHRLYSRLGTSEFVWEINKPIESNTRILTICAKDRPGLFSKMAGVFTLSGLDIFDARINTWKNNIALDIFILKPPVDQIFEEEKWAAAKENLESALSGKLDLAAVLKEKMSESLQMKPHMMGKPHRIEVDNESSSFFTIIEVFSYDFHGLLYSITNALFACGLDIRIAKIATKADQVVDVFYVVDFEGQKVDSEKQVSLIRTAISEVLPKPVL
ncbi:MAG: [protein-PII] uridylyltransferase [Desulfobacteraceae bacterium]|nr:MAG: [protein-PII] uridylyltransferase [Desulfobacteraceae bacterium]